MFISLAAVKTADCIRKPAPKKRSHKNHRGAQESQRLLCCSYARNSMRSNSSSPLLHQLGDVELSSNSFLLNQSYVGLVSHIFSDFPLITSLLSLRPVLEAKCSIMHWLLMRPHTEIVALEGRNHLESAPWKNNQTGQIEEHNIRHVFMMTGADPNTRWLGGCIALDAKCFIKTGPDLSPEDLSTARWPLVRQPYSKPVCRGSLQ
jgi:hypothetical protein